MRWVRRSHVARSIPKVAISRSNARASTTATSIPARRLAIRTSSASWPATPSRSKLEEWYNRHVVAVYKELGAFDGEGLFIADGTYLFVPDNPRYEGSQRLLFDEHNHPSTRNRNRP